MKNEGYYEPLNIRHKDGKISKFEIWIPRECANNNIKSKDDLLKKIYILDSKIIQEKIKLDNPDFIKNAPEAIIEKSKNKLNSFINEKELIMKYLDEIEEDD